MGFMQSSLCPFDTHFPMKFTHLLFDLDGTLTDPAVGIINAFLYALNKLKKPAVDRTTLGWIIGPPLRQSFLQFTKTGEEAECAVAYYREYFSDKGIFENELIPGIIPVLSELANRGVILFVATSKPRIYAEQIIGHFNMTPYFSKIYGSNLDGSYSNKADLIRLILNDNKTIPKSAFLMIGDRDLDISGAHQNGISGCAVHWGYGTDEELNGVGSDYHIQNPKELLCLI